MMRNFETWYCHILQYRTVKFQQSCIFFYLYQLHSLQIIRIFPIAYVKRRLYFSIYNAVNIKNLISFTCYSGTVSIVTADGRIIVVSLLYTKNIFVANFLVSVRLIEVENLNWRLFGRVVSPNFQPPYMSITETTY